MNWRAKQVSVPEAGQPQRREHGDQEAVRDRTHDRRSRANFLLAGRSLRGAFALAFYNGASSAATAHQLGRA